MRRQEGAYAFPFSVERGEDVIDLTIEGDGYYEPGKLSGPPEDCYPDEGEAEITSITCDGEPWVGELTHAERETAESLLMEKIQGH